MLYDPKWQEQTCLSPPVRILLDAADLIEKKGWCQGRSSAPQPSGGLAYCVHGAFAHITHLEAEYDADRQSDMNAATILLQRYLSANGQWDPTRAVMCTATWVNCAVWNDVKGRTKEEVITALRGAAQMEIERGGKVNG